MPASLSQNDALPAYNNQGTNNGLINPFLPNSQTPFRFWAKPVYTASDGTLWAPGFDGPTFATNPWDYIKIPGIPPATLAIAPGFGSFNGTVPLDRTPGICRIIGLAKKHQLDKKKPIGVHGSRNTYFGIEPPQFTIELLIWTPEQFRQLLLLWPYLVPPASKGVLPTVDVHHPLFELHDIKSIQCYGAEGPIIGADRKATFTIHAVEFSKPNSNNAVATPFAPLATVYDQTSYPLPASATP